MKHIDSTPREIGVMERVTEHFNGDVQIRLLLDMDTLFAQEASGPLAELFSFWNVSTPVRGLPLADACEVPDRLRQFMGKTPARVDVGCDDPMHYFLQNHPRLSDFQKFNDNNEKYLAEFPSRMNATSLAEEYYFCKMMRQPMYHEIDQTINGVSRHYRRLAVPAVDLSGSVTHIFYAINLLDYRPAPVAVPRRANDNLRS